VGAYEEIGAYGKIKRRYEEKQLEYCSFCQIN
jgi:hypothetical protein